eukprot:4513313-Pleurochrysis_carterae.AAC.1
MQKCKTPAVVGGKNGLLYRARGGGEAGVKKVKLKKWERRTKVKEPRRREQEDEIKRDKVRAWESKRELVRWRRGEMERE